MADKAKILALYHSLPYQDKRDMLAWFQADDLHYDILGALPLELVLGITTYLSLPDLVRLRRVSKRWLGILTSSAFIKSVLQECDPTGGLSLTIPAGSKPSHVSSIEIEHVDAFKNGKAFELCTWEAWKSRKGLGISENLLSCEYFLDYFPTLPDHRIMFSATNSAITASSGR